MHIPGIKSKKASVVMHDQLAVLSASGARQKFFFIPFVMATTRAKKSEQLEELIALFSEAKGIAFCAFSTLTVEEVESVRRALRGQNMRYIVAKKTLLALAAKTAEKAEFVPDDLEGAVAVIVSPDDAVLPAAAIKKMKKDFFNKATKTSKVDFAGAILDGKFLSAAETAAFADTPSREQSLAKIVGMLRSGPQKLHTVFNSGLQNMYTIMQDAEKFAS